MLVQSHDSGDLVERQALSLVEDSWAMEVVPRLPANLAEQARALKALQRVRGLASASGLRPNGRPAASGVCQGPPWRGTPGAVAVAGRRGARGGPGLWLAPQCGLGHAPAG